MAETLFDAPTELAIDDEGLLVADTGNCAVRLVGSQRVTYVAGAVGSCANGTIGAAVRDASRNLFYLTSEGIFHKAPSAATGTVRIRQRIFGMTLNPARTSLYWANLDGTVGRVQSASAAALAGSGTVIPTTIAGSTAGSSGDGGQASAAQVAPVRLAFDAANNLYIMQVNPYGGIRKIGAADGVINTHIPPIPATALGLAAEPNGAVWVSYSNHTIVRFGPDGKLNSATHGFGSASVPGSSNVGSGLFRNPSGLAIDRDGSVFVADAGNHLIRKITPVRARVEVISGNNQTGAPGAQLPLPIRLRVLGEDGEPFAGTPVGLFRLPLPPGEPTPDLVLTTDENGYAELKDLVLPEKTGEERFDARLARNIAGTPIVFTALNRLTSVVPNEETEAMSELTAGTLAKATGLDFVAEAVAAEPDTYPEKLGGVCVDIRGVRAGISKVSPTEAVFAIPGHEAGEVPVKLLLRCGQPDQEATNVLIVKVKAAN